MAYYSTIKDNTLTYFVSDNFDRDIVPSLKKELQKKLKRNKKLKIVLDLSAVKYMDTAALAFIIFMKSNFSQNFEIQNISNEIMHIFKLEKIEN